MLQDLIKLESINIDLQSQDKSEAIEEMIESLLSVCPVHNRQELLKLMLDREQKGTTGVGFGIAIPHAISDKIKVPVCAIGISKSGIDFESLDSKKVYVIIMILFPRDDKKTHLKIMQHLELVCCKSNFLSSIIEKKDAAAVASAIFAIEENL